MNIQAWLKSTESDLKKVGIDSARLDTQLLLENELKKPREWVLANNNVELSKENLTSLSNKVAQRKNRLPLAYIIGSKEFYGRTFFVNEDVLIPRPESEAIIEFLEKIIAKNKINTAIDIGTGSGVLAITTKLEHPDIHVTASDISPAALAVARKNARNLGAQIQFHQSDLFESLLGMPRTRPYVVLANLPYVPNKLITSPEITKEPSLALFSGDDGLKLYQTFWQQVGQLKKKPLFIITESLKTQHAQLSTLAKNHSYRLESTNTLAQLFTPIS